MKTVSHVDQHAAWQREHATESLFPSLHSEEPSRGVVEFFDWLNPQMSLAGRLGIEMGCGKGRNCLWLQRHGARMIGFDFVEEAIEGAYHRVERDRLVPRPRFLVHDATKPWPFARDQFSFGIDCFSTTDIETPEKRSFAAQEMIRVMTAGGFLLVYTLSREEQFHREMIVTSPSGEPNSFVHPEGKFEKVFDRDEVLALYHPLQLLKDRRVRKEAVIGGRTYDCNHHWMVFRKN